MKNFCFSLPLFCQKIIIASACILINKFLRVDTRKLTATAPFLKKSGQWHLFFLYIPRKINKTI